MEQDPSSHGICPSLCAQTDSDSDCNSDEESTCPSLVFSDTSEHEHANLATAPAVAGTAVTAAQADEEEEETPPLIGWTDSEGERLTRPQDEVDSLLSKWSDNYAASQCKTLKSRTILFEVAQAAAQSSCICKLLLSVLVRSLRACAHMHSVLHVFST